ncbi:MAG: leucine-rich repeat domain-containing protein [Clostridia bacterium]|nr:leucine-rich repeat domain-containing protein [Clostridia bacterium]
MNKKQLFIKLLILVVGGISVFLLSSCFTSMRILSCKKSCLESCSSESISGNEYGIYYTLSDDGESYYVSEVGYSETSVVIPETYEGLPVEGIESGAFTHYHHSVGCGGTYPVEIYLSSLTLPKTIKVIEREVFSNGYGDHFNKDGYGAGCEKLIYEGTVEDWCNIKFGSSPFSHYTDFYIDGAKVTDLVIPESVTTIPENAFAYYNKFKSVTLHEGITTIEKHAFYRGGVEEITFPCTDLTIGKEAFFENTELEKIAFTGEKLNLGERVFAYCTSLKDVEWNTVNITEIPEYTFANCYGLESFVIPASVEVIDWYAFEDCVNLIEVDNLSKLKVVAGDTTYGGVAFYAGIVHTAEEDNSYILTVEDYKFVIGEESATLFKYTGADEVLFLPVLESGAEYDIRANTFLNNNLITTVIIPDCVTAIGTNAFYYCQNLQYVTGCAGLVTVGNGAFNGCERLVSISLGKVEEIGNTAFANCSAMKSVSLPDTLTKIGWDAFANCEGLTSITLPASIKEIGRDAFLFCNAEIKYAGTVEEWTNNVTHSGYGVTVTVICSDGEWEGTI